MQPCTQVVAGPTAVAVGRQRVACACVMIELGAGSHCEKYPYARGIFCGEFFRI